MPDADAPLTCAADTLRAGGLAAFPTETVYGLGALALDDAAVARIFAAKGRPATNPLIVHVADADAAHRLTSDWTAAAERLAARFWPGPLTLVLKRVDAVPDAVTAGGDTVALRVPAHPLALELLRAVGQPVAAPSANRSGCVSPTTAEHVRQSLGTRVDFILDGGPCPGGLESTVVDATGPTLKLLRPGLVTVADLEALGLAVELPGTTGGPLRSPGMLARHYAPRTRLILATTDAERDALAGAGVARWVLPASPVEAAATLYAELHRFDAGGHAGVVVTLPPATDEWRAVRDRLTRGAV